MLCFLVLCVKEKKKWEEDELVGGFQRGHVGRLRAKKDDQGPQNFCDFSASRPTRGTSREAPPRPSDFSS